jgi:hypothetical protein
VPERVIHKIELRRSARLEMTAYTLGLIFVFYVFVVQCKPDGAKRRKDGDKLKKEENQNKGQKEKMLAFLARKVIN